MATGSIGCEVLRLSAQGVCGRVSAVFARAVHLHAGDLIVTFGTTELASHPYTISYPAFTAGVEQGAAFRLRGRNLIIDGRRLDLSALEEFTPCYSVSSCASDAQQSVCLDLARQEALAGCPGDGLAGLLLDEGTGNIFTSIARPLVQEVSEAIRSERWVEMIGLAAGLAGLGPGLTPSGDDFLCGLLAALLFHRESGRPGPPPEILTGLARVAGERTSPFSAQMLHGAARGLVSKTVADWLVAVHRGERAVIPALTRELIDFGHTSGTDTLVGLITGLDKPGGDIP